MNLLKKYKQISIEFTPNATQQRAIDKHWKKQRLSQQQSARQSQVNDEMIQFTILDHEKFQWEDDLLDIACEQLIKRDILYTSHLYRDKIFEKVLNDDLLMLDERFVGLEAINLKKTFYNKHNEIMKLRNDGRLDVNDLKPYQTRLNEYIQQRGMIFASASLDADQG